MHAVPVPRRVERVRHEIKRREVEVVAVDRPSPGFASITFGGGSLADFVSLSFDDHVKLMFETANGEQLRRDYTPRGFSNAERRLTIDFALHGHGAATEWARQARIGQKMQVAGPRSSMLIPVDYSWHLLAGDASALPAIRRRLEELPGHTRAIVAVCADQADRLPFDTRAGLDLHWAATADELVDVLRAQGVPAGEGFVWCAGEASLMGELRRMYIEEREHPRESARIAAYWKRGAADVHEQLV